jgi:hypothetical protein
MSVGFRVRNNGVIQIDDAYKNLELLQKSVVIANLAGGIYKYVHLNVPLLTSSLIAISSVYGVFCQKINDTTLRINIVSNSNEEQSAEVFVFGPPSNEVVSGGVGLVVRNSSGLGVVYNSAKDYLKILGVKSGKLASGTSVSGSFPNRKLAVIQSMRPYRFQGGHTTVNGVPYITRAVSGGVVSTPSLGGYLIDHRLLYSSRSEAAREIDYHDTFEYLSYACLIVDVTGY